MDYPRAAAAIAGLLTLAAARPSPEATVAPAPRAEIPVVTDVTAEKGPAPFPVADEVLFHAEPLPLPPLAALRGTDTLAAEIFRARATAVVAVVSVEGQGSGSIVRGDGWVLTCAHVVGTTPFADVVLRTGETYRAHVVAADPVADLALLRFIPEKPVAWLPIGDLDAVAVGDPVIAIGHPKGFGWTVNDGIVSNLFVFRDGERDPGVIQTQVPVNPGNSGGPLLDRGGRLIGVVSQGDPAAQSLNWSISSRSVKSFLLHHADLMPTATLRVDATPPGATILVDGIGIGIAPHATTRIATGAHVVTVRKEGLGSVDAPVVVLQRDEALLRVRLAPAGTLAVTADTTDVAIYVDGVFRGIAPISIDVAEGPHEVNGVKHGSRESHQHATVVAEHETEVAVSHPTSVAYLSVMSAPVGAEVVLDGEAVGPTPVNERIVEPGRHVVDVRKGDATARRVVVDLVADARRQLEFDLGDDLAATPDAAAGAPASAALDAHRVSRESARLQSGVSLALGGAALGIASAAVLLTQKDAPARAAATAGLVAGSAGLLIGPILLYDDVNRGGGGRSPPHAVVPGVQASLSF